MTVRAPSTEREHGHPASQESPAMGEKEQPVEVRSRDGSKVLEPDGLDAFNDSRITKLIST